jgi:hypothetical protein
MSNFNIPWKCLDFNPAPSIPPSEPANTIPQNNHETQRIDPDTSIPQRTIAQSISPTEPIIPQINPATQSISTDTLIPQKTFAQALTNICDIPLSQIQQPVVKGDRLAIEIPEAVYEAGLEACKHNLHGRILWPKGSTPLSVVALKAKLALIWKDLSTWGIISLGKGYYEFTFSSLEDVRRVRSFPSWNLNPGLLKFFAWTKDFNPRLQQNTSVQVWVKIFGLSQEYWHKTILFTIAGSVGTPICVDAITAKPMHERTFGQFARVLIEIDLMQPLRYKLLVERKGYAFFVDLEYEHIPDFCSECKRIGHSFDNCRRWNNLEELKNNKEKNMKQKAHEKNEKNEKSEKNEKNEKKKIYVQTKDGRPKPSDIINVENEVINVEEHDTTPHNFENGTSRIVAGQVMQEQAHLSPHGGSTAAAGSSSQARPHEGSVAAAGSSSQAHIRQQNSFHILSPVSPKQRLLEQDKQLEQELNEDTDVSWSTDSFVDTTQDGAEALNVNANTMNHVSRGYSSPRQEVNKIVSNVSAPGDGEASKHTPISDKVARDMAFLKESWANMTEADEAFQTVDTTCHDAGNTDQGFQVHMSRQQKKTLKKVKHSSRDSYATRSKVASKPFR